MARTKNFSVLIGFPEARKLFVGMFQKAANAPASNNLSPSTLRKVFDPENQDNTFWVTTQQAIIDRVNPDNLEILFSNLSALMGFTENSDDWDQLLNYLGAFKYCRKSPRGLTIRGKIEIFQTASGAFEFSNWLEIAGTLSSKPDHRGIVLKYENWVFLFGVTHSHFRPIILLHKSDLSRSIVPGYVTTFDGSGALFSAKCFLVHKSHDKFEAGISDIELDRILDEASTIPGVLS